jgi:hypothetical protein
MTKGHKGGRREIKPSLVGHKAPAARTQSDAAAPRGGESAPEVGRDVDCELPDSDLVRNSPGAAGGPGERPARGRKPSSGPER